MPFTKKVCSSVPPPPQTEDHRAAGKKCNRCARFGNGREHHVSATIGRVRDLKYLRERPIIDRESRAFPQGLSKVAEASGAKASQRCCAVENGEGSVVRRICRQREHKINGAG